MELHKWKEKLLPYELAVEELKLKFNHMIKENEAIGRYSYIEGVQGRVKSISGIIDKARRKDIPLDEVWEKLYDIAGIRLICQFSEDIYKVVGIIHMRSDMEVADDRNYLVNPKPSGYRSYHVIIHYTVNTVKGAVRIPVEIQIRTMAMDFWATLEHSLQYKYNGDFPTLVGMRLKSAAEAVLRMDSEMSAIRDEIITAQDSYISRVNLVAQIKNNIEGLYTFDDRAAIINIQSEFLELYENGTLEELKEFAQKLDNLAARYRVQEL